MDGAVSLSGSIRMGDGLIYRVGCRLIFDENAVIIKWPAVVCCEEKI